MIIVENNINKKEFINSENIAKFFVFLLPIGSAVVKNWSSAFFVFLFFVSVYWLSDKQNRSKIELCRREKVLLSLCVLFFVSFLLSELFNGWEGVKSHWIGIEARYLLFVPIYLMIRNLDNIVQILVKGFVITGIVLAAQSLYDLFVADIPRATGVYHHIYFGAVSVVCLLVVLYSGVHKWSSYFWRALGVISIIGSLFSVAASSSRSSYIGIVLLFALYPFLLKEIKVKFVLPVYVGLFLSCFLIYSNSNLVQNRVDVALEQFSNYVNANSEQRNDYEVIGSVGVRFEYWKASIYIFHDNPFFGVGRSGYVHESAKLIDQNKVSQAIRYVTDPHNVFLNILSGKGLFGLCILVGIFFVLFVNYYKNWQINREVGAKLGMIFLVEVLIFSMTESGAFHRGHWLSLNLLLFAVFSFCCSEADESEYLYRHSN